MAEVETILYLRLRNYGVLSALIGTRVYPVQAPQDPTHPFVTYQRIDTTRETGMVQDHGMTHPRIQVNAWGITYASSRAVAAAVKAALGVGSGRYEDTTSDPIILDVICDDEADDFEPDTRAYRYRMDFTIWHRE